MNLAGATWLLLGLGWMAGILYSRHYIHSFINPVVIFSSIWLLSYSLFSLRLLNYYPLSSLTCWVISIGYISYMIGLMLPFLFLNPARAGAGDTGYEVEFPHGRFNFFIMVFYLLGLLGFYLLYTEISRYFTLEQLQDPLVFRILREMLIENRIGGRLTDYLFICTEIALVYAVFYSVLFRRKYLRIGLFFLTALASSLISTGRSQLFVYVFDLFGAYLFTKTFIQREPIRKRILLLFPLLLTVGFGGIGVLLLKSIKFTRHIDTENIVEAQFYMIYFYMTSAFGALNRLLMDDRLVLDYGRNMLAPLLRLVSAVVQDVQAPPVMQPFTNIPYKTNVYTSLRVIYQDFGLVGVSVIPCLVGWVISWIWGRVSVFRRIAFLPLICHFSFILFMTAFEDLFFRTTPLLVYLFAILFLRLSGLQPAAPRGQSRPISSR